MMKVFRFDVDYINDHNFPYVKLKMIVFRFDDDYIDDHNFSYLILKIVFPI